MNKKWIAIAALGLLSLAGCAGPMNTTPPANSTAASSLSQEAQSALTQAEADVAAAKKQKALWTTADKALKSAQEAAKKADNAAVIKNAKIASSEAAIGIAQLKYPSTDTFK